MKITVASPFLVALLALVLSSASPVQGETTKAKGIPGHGKLQAVDTSAQTVTLEGKTARVFHVTPTTKIIDGSGNAATLSSAVVGEDVGIYYDKATKNLLTLRLGAKTGTKTAAATPAASSPSPEPATPSAEPTPTAAKSPSTPAAETTAAATTTKAKKQRFSGKVVSVDVPNNTIVVHGKADQTFTVTTATKITGADGLGAITAGEKVSGSYEKSTDGATLTVTSLKVTK